jgi:hypothetical protein
LDLLDAQRVELQAEDAYAESHSNSGMSAVPLYKSPAGGSSAGKRLKLLKPRYAGTPRQRLNGHSFLSFGL